jgi:hypothetical protein
MSRTRRGGARKRRAKASAAARAAAATPSSPRLGVATMFACLPDDALRRIFSYVSGWEAALLAEVARAWRSWIQRDAGNWERRFFRDFHAVADARAERERLRGIFDGLDLDGAIHATAFNFDAYANTNSCLAYSAALDVARPYVLRLWEDETQYQHRLGSIPARELRLLRPREIWRGYHALELPDFDLSQPDDDASWQLSPDFAKTEQALDNLFALHKDELHNMYELRPAPGYEPSRLLPDGADDGTPLITGLCFEVDFSREADESTHWWLLYTEAATELLHGRCRVCNNDRCSNCAVASGCFDEHPVLGVRMCELSCCQGQYPVMMRSAACEELAAALHISMAEAQQRLNAVACSPADCTYRASRRTRRLTVLRSSLEALIWASLPTNDEA